MVCVRGLDSKTYEERMARGKPLPEVPCPNPSCNDLCLRGHGWHKRYLDGERVALRRLRCPRCRVSHVLLPEPVQELLLQLRRERRKAAVTSLIRAA